MVGVAIESAQTKKQERCNQAVREHNTSEDDEDADDDVCDDDSNGDGDDECDGTYDEEGHDEADTEATMRCMRRMQHHRLLRSCHCESW